MGMQKKRKKWRWVNEFIEKLLKRSAANKEKNDASVMARDKLSKRGFSSQYDRPSFVGVHYKDSDKVDMILKEEFDKMLANGKVKQTYESKVSKKTGEISDDYAKPIFVFNWNHWKNAKTKNNRIKKFSS